MTVYVSEKSEDVLSGIEKMKDAMIKSYKGLARIINDLDLILTSHNIYYVKY